jgi:nucleotide-binding universal stress UspA family protein
MDYKKIVCGVTGSINSLKAALEAAHIAERSAASLTYVYAVDSAFLKSGLAVDLDRELVEKEESLERLGGHVLDYAGELATAQGVVPRKTLKRGPMLDVLRDVVAAEQADLLVLGNEETPFIEKPPMEGDVSGHIRGLMGQSNLHVLVVN